MLDYQVYTLHVIVMYTYTNRIFYHQNLVKLYGICTEGGPVLVVTEHLVNG